MNKHESKISPDISNLCAVCNGPETTEHYTVYCTAYLKDRQDLVNTLKDILHKKHFICSVTDIKLLSGNNDEISSEGRTNLISAHEWYKTFFIVFFLHLRMSTMPRE